MAKFAIEYIKICLRKGLPGFLENPSSSMIFDLPWIQKMVQRGILKIEKCDFCQYGTSYRKPTKILHWNCNIELARCHAVGGRCSATNSKHVVLTGVSGGAFMTKHAQVYPRKFAKHLMNQVIDAVLCTHPP